MDIKYLSDFFYKHKKKGELNGTCIVCARNTYNGIKIDFSTNFMSSNLLHSGECICPNCYELTRNQEYRKHSWIATSSKIKIITKKDIELILTDPPNKPFGFYITTTGQKQGFLLLISKIATDKDYFFLAFDDKLIFFDRDEYNQMLPFAKVLREKGLTKYEIKGKLKTKTFSKLNTEEYQQINQYKGNPLWELIIYAIK